MLDVVAVVQVLSSTVLFLLLFSHLCLSILCCDSSSKFILVILTAFRHTSELFLTLERARLNILTREHASPGARANKAKAAKMSFKSESGLGRFKSFFKSTSDQSTSFDPTLVNLQDTDLPLSTILFLKETLIYSNLCFK